MIPYQCFYSLYRQVQVEVNRFIGLVEYSGLITNYWHWWNMALIVADVGSVISFLHAGSIYEVKVIRDFPTTVISQSLSRIKRIKDYSESLYYCHAASLSSALCFTESGAQFED